MKNKEFRSQPVARYSLSQEKQSFSGSRESRNYKDSPGPKLKNSINLSNKKGDVLQSYVAYIAIGVAVFILGLLIYLVISGKLAGIAEYIKDLFT